MKKSILNLSALLLAVAASHGSMLTEQTVSQVIGPVGNLALDSADDFAVLQGEVELALKANSPGSSVSGNTYLVDSGAGFVLDFSLISDSPLSYTAQEFLNPPVVSSYLLSGEFFPLSGGPSITVFDDIDMLNPNLFVGLGSTDPDSSFFIYRGESGSDFDSTELQSSFGLSFGSIVIVPADRAEIVQGSVSLTGAAADLSGFNSYDPLALGTYVFTLSDVTSGVGQGLPPEVMIEVVVIPEPSVIGGTVLGLGLIGLVLIRRRAAKTKA